MADTQNPSVSQRVDKRSHQVSVAAAATVLRAINVTHWFSTTEGTHLALDAVSLEVTAGEFVCLVGPSGCGKTTLLNTIAGQISAEKGNVEVVDQAGEPLDRASIGYMFARDSLIPWRTVQRNVEFGLEVRKGNRAARRSRAREMLELVGLGDKGYLYPQQLSHGMRQRANLARTLSIDPQLLLVDEPFGALDAQTKAHLQEEFLRIWESSRKTVVFVTHDLTEACLLADRIVVMREGRIAREVVVDFPRPRNLDALRFEARFQALVKSLWSLISGED